MKKYIFIIFLTLIFVVGFNFLRYNVNGFLNNQKTTIQIVENQLKVPVGEITNKLIISQDFIGSRRNLSGLDLFFSTFNRKNDSAVTVQIVCNNKVLRAKTIDTKNLKDNSFYHLDFDPIFDSNDKALTLKIISGESKAENAVTLWKNPTNENYKIKINDKIEEGSLVFNLKYTNTFNLISSILSGIIFCVLNCGLIRLLTFIRE